MDPQPKPPRKPRGKRAELAAWLEREHPAAIAPPEWDRLRTELAPVSEGYLRKLLRESGVALAAMVEGVRQDTFEALEASLLALLAEYQKADAGRQRLVRRLVIQAKDHARWAARQPGRRAEKEEMALWMLTWLENPPLFPQWVRLRRRAGGSSHGGQ
jgi:hypothetical protein